mmetsp:Transcript_6237/g.13769  ORF Transcript_6237/g.13769 Transcript_6237/m.13769 type:complete len:469 (+) Transcript_6237:276-1682(+)|eukprot:CAMPEP_0173198150 /NCGR_PEP_ID=MMETSP1141-20130122/16537_1 /TAXON_ID=483371 /ORGANISM="non described non described, Strain CCMP2298" /LENGTH=468 /DNA_ID=CAMNT_0014122931 /DNA_START=225 /DNA_END=1631 /DNA_ORIENTATION=-
MGGGVSTDDTYKLRVIRGSQGAPASPVPQRKSSVSQISPLPEIRSPPEHPVLLANQKSGLKRQGSKLDEEPPESVKLKHKQLSRQGSALTGHSEVQDSLSDKNGRLSRQGTQKNLIASGKDMNRQASSVGFRGTMCSPLHPWLLKSLNTGTTTLLDYELGRVIGRGLMGTVRIGRNKANKYVVFKAISKEYVIRHNDHRHIKNEKEILAALSCSFCVKLFGTFQDRNNVYFALEYCPGGELFQRLGRKKQFPPAVAKFYISEVCVALAHVQDKGYVYRDLKPENILLDEEGHCKLVDFGFATPAADASTKLKTLCGTPAYLSPEQLDGKFTNGYTRVVDWWSFGVLVFELLTGKTPFCKSNKESHYEIFLRILNKKISFPWGFDPISKDLVSQLCHANLDRRLCLPESIKAHKYFEIPWEAVANRELVPPFVPRIKEEGDVHYFKSYPFSGPRAGSDEGENRYGYFDF